MLELILILLAIAAIAGLLGFGRVSGAALTGVKVPASRLFCFCWFFSA
jgi:uncharacterized membrane protein YtjA (UPF0391 family)